MTVLSAQTIRQLCRPLAFGEDPDLSGLVMITPFDERTQHEPSGCSYGLSACGYDVRLDQDVYLGHEGIYTNMARVQFALASTMERFHMPDDVVGIVHDKSTWARRGLAVQNTVIEPGWRGFLTLELTLHGTESLRLSRGTPIAQIVFHRLDTPTEQPYPDGAKYQDQERGPVPARDGAGHD